MNDSTPRRVPRRATIALVAVLAVTAAGVAGAATTRHAATKDSLVVLAPNVAPAIDWDGTGATYPGLWMVIANTYEPLIEYPTIKRGDLLVPNYKAKANQFAPRLASSWTKKGLVWTFKLRKGVKSCAGNELTADDVIYTFQRAISVSGASPVAWFLGNVAGIFPLAPVLPNAKPADKQLHGEVRKIDRLTVQFRQSTPSELFPRVLTIAALGIFDSKEMRSHATAKDPWTHEWANTQGAAGFGPYCLSRWIKGQSVELDANPNYYLGKAQIQHVVVRGVAQDANRVAAVRAGDADIVTALTPQEYHDLQKQKDVKVLGDYNNQTLSLWMNYAAAPWNLPTNKLLRQAIAYAIPYAEIVAKDYYGDARQWFGQVQSNYFGYKPIRRYTTDLAKAKALLAQAGFPDGKGLAEHASGLQLFYNAERASVLEPIANRIRTALAQIGIPITLQPIPASEFASREQVKRDMPMALPDENYPLGSDAGYAYQLSFLSAKAGGLSNSQNYENAALDKVYEASKAATGAKRRALLDRIQVTLMDDLPKIPIVERKSQIAVRSNVTNYYLRPDNALAFWYFKAK